jgi:hypothetical protein
MLFGISGVISPTVHPIIVVNEALLSNILNNPEAT